jgi:hypothetical protein
LFADEQLASSLLHYVQMLYAATRTLQQKLISFYAGAAILHKNVPKGKAAVNFN